MATLRRTLAGIALTTSVLALGHCETAHACGATAEQVTPLLPEDGAADVPLNAVLQATSVLSRVKFELVEAETGRLVPLGVSCDGHYDGNLCVASAGLLQPSTAYIWRVVPDSEQGLEPVERSFVTGTSEDQETPVANDWSLDVVRDQEAVVGCFSDGRLVTFRFVAHDTDGPVVVAVPGSVPSTTQQALVARPGQPVELALGNPPECFSIRLTDAAGNAKALPAYCLPAPSAQQGDAGSGTTADGSAPTELDEDSAPTSPADSTAADCAMRPPSTYTSPAWLVVIAALVGIGSRRSRARTRMATTWTA